MYTFDVSEEKALETYKQLCTTYEQIFKELDIPVIKGKKIVY